MYTCTRNRMPSRATEIYPNTLAAARARVLLRRESNIRAMTRRLSPTKRKKKTEEKTFLASRFEEDPTGPSHRHPDRGRFDEEVPLFSPSLASFLHFLNKYLMRMANVPFVSKIPHARRQMLTIDVQARGVESFK